MAYSDKVLDHYENPRNVGSFAKNAEDVGTGMVGAPACGDVRKLQIRVGKDGVIEDAKFKTYGCARHRLVVARHRMGQGQDARPGGGDTQDRDRAGARAASGEDPLLDPRRGCDQGGRRRLQDQA
jgi:hypothetical protein